MRKERKCDDRVLCNIRRNWHYTFMFSEDILRKNINSYLRKALRLLHMSHTYPVAFQRIHPVVRGPHDSCRCEVGVVHQHADLVHEAFLAALSVFHQASRTVSSVTNAVSTRAVSVSATIVAAATISTTAATISTTATVDIAISVVTTT